MLLCKWVMEEPVFCLQMVNQQDQRLSWPCTTLDGWFFRGVWVVGSSVGGWEMETPAP